MEKINKHKLNRAIPAEVMRSVRQRCGFGCVICGNALYQYEHFNPEFFDATFHDPNGITLLCGGCHDRKSRGILSKDAVSKANDNPKCLEQGFSKGPFDIGSKHPEIVFGTLTFINVPIPIQMYNEPIFIITPPKEEGEIFKISATLRDKNGNVILKIQDNEWLTPSIIWDCEVTGTRIYLRTKSRQIELILRSEPPLRIVVEKLIMNHRGYNIICKERENLKIEQSNGKIIQVGSALIENSKIGVDFNENGLFIGVGGGTIKIKTLKIN